MTASLHARGHLLPTSRHANRIKLGAFGLGVEGPWDPDVEPHVGFVLAQLGLTPLGARPWHEDELGNQRAAVLPLD